MKKAITLWTILGSFLLAGVAQSNTLTLVNEAPPSIAGPGSGQFTWKYDVNFANSTVLTGGSSSSNGSFVTLTGILGGIVGIVSNPAGWTASFVVGGTSITWNWTGTNNTQLGGPTGAPGTLTGFNFISNSNFAIAGFYNSRDTVTTGAGAGNNSTATGFVSVPGAVPETGSALVLLGIGLAAVEALRRMFWARKA